MKNIYQNIYENKEIDYNPNERISPECAGWVIKHILKEISSKNISNLLDIGGGDGYLPSFLLQHSLIQKYVIVDISKNMLSGVIARFKENILEV